MSCAYSIEPAKLGVNHVESICHRSFIYDMMLTIFVSVIMKSMMELGSEIL